MVDLGLGLTASEAEIGDTVAGLAADADRRERLSRAGQRLCDGRGTERVVEVLLG